MKKTKLTRSLLAAVSIVALSAVMYGCVHDGGSDPEPVVEPMPDPEPEPDPGPTDLEQTQMDAAAAATAAGEAATAAAADAKAAADATATIATLQTGEMAKMHAMGASDAADAAMAAYMAAKAASADAAAATTGPDAEAAWARAVSAQGDAEDAAMMAADMSEDAVEAAMTELHIDGTMKSVGDVTIDAMSDSSSVTTGTGADAKTVITGLIKSMNPMGTSPAITGRAYVPAVTDDLTTAEIEAAVPAMPYRQDAAARTFAIGKTVDSDDDMARLMIVTDYPGTNMVRVFSPGASGSDVSGTKAGYISVDPATGAASTDAAHANNTALRSEGMFVPVSGGTDGTLAFGDTIAADAKAVELFSYTWTNTATPL